VSSHLQFQYANFRNDAYNKSGKGSLRLQLINQRADFAFALFSGGFSAVRLQLIQLMFSTLILSNELRP
jgi:hypothetical protein